MPQAPGTPALHARAQQLEFAPTARTRDRAGRDLGPQALGLAVVHENIRLVEQTRYAVGSLRTGDATIEDHSGTAQRTPADQHGAPTHGVVDQLVVVEDRHRIGTGFAVPFEAQDDGFILPGEISRAARGPAPRVIEGRDAVSRRASGSDLRRPGHPLPPGRSRFESAPQPSRTRSGERREGSRHGRPNLLALSRSLVFSPNLPASRQDYGLERRSVTRESPRVATGSPRGMPNDTSAGPQVTQGLLETP